MEIFLSKVQKIESHEIVSIHENADDWSGLRGKNIRHQKC